MASCNTSASSGNPGACNTPCMIVAPVAASCWGQGSCTGCPAWSSQVPRILSFEPGILNRRSQMPALDWRSQMPVLDWRIQMP
eukprot:754865-Pelagomonas_calceolata.AAC.1